jgi:hypothetical protein
MRSKARQILSSFRQRLLFLCICIFSTIFISANGDPIDAQTTDNSVASRIYYVTIPIDRSVGPYLRQLKLLIPDVPAPYNDSKLYDGDTWDQLVDKLLTKKDSNVRDRRTPTQVVVPLPAGCFDSSMSMEKREQCLQNPAAFAKGYLTLRLYDVKDGDSLPDVLSRHGVYPTREGSSYYNQQRWSDVVQNFNPRINQWNNLNAGSVFILPLLNESESRARDAAKTVASAPVVESEPAISNASDVKDAGEQLPVDGQAVPLDVVSPVTEVAPTAATPPAPIPQPVVPVPVKPAQPVVAETPAPPRQPSPAPKPVQIVAEPQAPEEEVVYVDELPPPKKIVYAREPQSDLSFSVARNVLSSVRIPMMARQNHLNLSYTRSDPGNSDWWINVYQSPIVKGKSDSPYLIETDDSSERFKFSNLELGTKFYMSAPVPTWSIYAGLYARWMALDLRYWISNNSDETAYLVNRKAFRNVGAGVTAGVDHSRGNVRYRFNVAKDLYEFVDQAVHIDRTNARFSASFRFPKVKERGKTQRHVDLFTESETLNVNVISDSAMLQVTMKRLSVGVGAGLVW